MALAKLQLTPEHQANVKAILHKYVPHYDVWVFGSRAKHMAKPYSDLDLAIITQQPLPLETQAALNEAFEESDLPWKVDVLDWVSTSPEFQAIIQRDKVVIQEAW